jgi:hypothetical protein
MLVPPFVPGLHISSFILWLVLVLTLHIHELYASSGYMLCWLDCAQQLPLGCLPQGDIHN